NPVIVLTRWELEGTFPPPMCWRGHPRLTPVIEGTMSVRHDLLGLAEATQQLHLDMPSISVERHERLERRRAVKARTESAAAAVVSAAAVTPVEQATSPPTAGNLEPDGAPRG